MGNALSNPEMIFLYQLPDYQNKNALKLYKAKEKNDDFVKSYSQMINKFTKEFSNFSCKDNGEIVLDKMVRFNSATAEP